MFKLALLLLPLALFITRALAYVPASRRETNGDRLRRGLNPLAPRKLYDATRAQTAKRSIPSGSLPPDSNPFSCDVGGGEYAVCCDVTQLSVDMADSAALGYTEYMAPEDACYVYFNEIVAGSYWLSPGCIYGTGVVPLCCVNTFGSLSGAGYYPGVDPSLNVYNVDAVHECYSPDVRVPYPRARRGV